MNLYDDVRYLKGVGPKMSAELHKCGVFTILDLLLYFPRDYEYIKSNKYFKETTVNENVILKCTVEKILQDSITRTRKKMSTVIFNDSKSTFKGIWFNQPYAKRNFVLGNSYMIYGKIQKLGREIVLINPKIVKGNVHCKDKIIAKYPLKGKLTNSFMSRIISQVLNCVEITENMPLYIINKFKFCSLKEALINIHIPMDYNKLNEAKRRLKFQELFTYSLKILMLRHYINKSKLGISFSISPELKLLKEKIPFSLTNAQSRVIREILIDEKSNKPMNRLLQGDVGCGKTIVAIISIFNVAMNGYQVAMMVPTEILARQHYNEMCNILRDFDLSIELLVGSTSNKNKKLIKERLKNGEIDIIVGTHSLLEYDVEFKKLGFVVTDEQHRFGVNQRCVLLNKGNNIDVLVMTATPIPRTLTLYLYGDLDVSVIDELPPGRKKVETYYLSKFEKNRVYKFALEQIKQGRQIYIVCPLIEENENMVLTSVDKLYNELKDKYFSDSNVAVLHGKMNGKEKEDIMLKFKNHDIDVLISTTVIEVGINVPNASVMIIENAERFGLAQLHQLRGRVGRGKYKSYCILIADIKSDITKRRMETMKKSSDGFFIAEEDLKIRGSGELFGLKQHGEDELILADVVEDFELLKYANEEAKKLLLNDEQEYVKIKEDILKKIDKSSTYICFN
ncbi:ATP-dependent DNA helicase RecG [Clostridium tepidiprofundi DSM 19306]|uniref:ATP-dependent DNA helicase RecG n=1 Tax=Clostridium tepidiprofundi DSM 19306 TaxID=1121338 RepID=A0A151B7N8_9CLOT|nr:ATP-dependent DNA helicase RecG [Clostridium tepidiprofundi]KYH35904.1 ATP-dependent DNA helicase RecG [Clostridium tepidiprofundi DSM 19306]